VFRELQAKLLDMPWKPEPETVSGYDASQDSLWTFYWEIWRHAGVMLTDIEREGVCVNLPHLRAASAQARAESAAAEEAFKLVSV
jgi:hypothetical protein